ncbi:MAG TPA: HNH endonuclease signature motif containing protein, partial [Kofleriaceae bacterium]|nr:HNH endonuclease signature motif containing protein [Kofleriaceae bacterium]
REAEALQIWRPLGMVSMLDYLERACGYSPRTAQDRLRVARSLGALPQLAAALASAQLAHSAVRELTRVATPGTEAAWLAAATGKNLRQIEELVAEHHPGDRPDDPPDPRARMHAVRFELSAETFARLRQTRAVLDDEHGTNLDDDAFIASLCGAVLHGAPRTEPSSRAKFQIAVTVCQRCRRGWQDGAGARVAIDDTAVALAMCDAQHIGPTDGAAPERAHQDIPPRTVRAVWHRDGGRCRVDGCRSSRGLEIHHIIHRADGGSHDASNLILACSACHLAHHRGALTISGTADQLEVHRRTDAPVGARNTAAAARTDAPVGAGHGSAAARTDAPVGAGHVPATARTGAPVGAGHGLETCRAHAPAGTGVEASSTGAELDGQRPSTSASGATAIAAAPGACVGGTPTTDTCLTATAGTHVGSSSQRDMASLRAEARAALTGLGWKPAIAHAAVDAATAVRGADATLEQLIFEALRRCPVPRA